MNFSELSEKYHLRSFLNSFLRDFGRDSRIKLSPQTLSIKCESGETFKVSLLAYSILGSHRYDLSSLPNGFLDFARKLTLNFFEQIEETAFIAQVENSLLHMERFLSNARSNTRKDGPCSYVDSEQNLVLGHPFHPYPKSRSQMTLQDSQLYSAEMGASFPLKWVKLPRENFLSNLDFLDFIEMTSSLIPPGLSEQKNQDFAWVPMHPWQWLQIQKQEKFTALEVHDETACWSALSSTRTLHKAGEKFQLKFSLSVRLTNSLRHLSIVEVLRGAQMKEVLEKLDLISKYPTMNFMLEPFYVSYADDHQKACPEFLVSFRESLPPDNENVCLLAYLTETDAHTDTTRISHLLKSQEEDSDLSQRNFFQSFLDNLLSPILKLALDDGVLLGAHLQNLLVKVEDLRIVSFWYRDFQGSGFSEDFYEREQNRFAFLDKSHGNILSDEDINKVFGYYFIINTVFGLISALANSSARQERLLLAQLRVHLFNLSAQVKNNSFINFLLNSKLLYQKGNFRCSVQDLNESTLSEPWTIYNELCNPIVAELRQLAILPSGQTVHETKLEANNTLSFQVFDLDEHLEKFHEWHNKNYISDFWEMPWSKERLGEYIQGILNSCYQDPLILKVNGQPVGYFETYWAFEDRIAPYCRPEIYDRGVHLLIGEESYLHTKISYHAMLQVTKYLFEANAKTRRIWGEPRADNKKIMKFANALPGWEFIREFDFPHKRAALICAERDSFFKELNDV